MSEIDQFQLVLAVARTRSISEVALICGLSQPTVTRAVSATERLVGFPLFERTSDGTVPTPKSRDALRLIEQLISIYDELASLDGTTLTVLRFAYRDGELPTLLDSSVARWNREKPVPATLTLSDDPIAALQAGDVEFAVARYTDGFPAGLESEPLRVIRTDRIDLVHRAPPCGTVTEFKRLLG